MSFSAVDILRSKTMYILCVLCGTVDVYPLRPLAQSIYILRGKTMYILYVLVAQSMYILYVL
jgi:hypothetical protein